VANPLIISFRIEGAFTQEQAAEVTQDVWARLGFDPNDKKTWTRVRTNMPHHRDFDAATLAPRAWEAICELCGGEDAITPDSRWWHDSLIVNLGSAELEGKPTPPQELDGWHVDGDFFVHYLDSPEQGLLIIPLFSDIGPDGGATFICPEAIPIVAKHLYDHPEGVSPRMVTRDHEDFGKERNLGWFNNVAANSSHFVEATGKTGDVYLLHPLMLHSASSNANRTVRIITNPPVHMKKPFEFNRADGNYTLVERATLRALGKKDGEGLGEWKITRPREGVVPMRIKIQQQMKKEEEERIAALKKEEAPKTVRAAA
jgi:hypothetical protein